MGDRPTASKESVKLLMAVAANEGFKLASVDIRAAFLQAKTLDREVFVQPPKDIRKEGVIWKLKKPLYGLDDASRKFWLKVKEMFLDLGLWTMVGDEAFYYLHRDGKLHGAVLTHVDYFTLAGTEEFLRMVLDGVSGRMVVSKVEKDKFRYTGLDIRALEDGVEISMKDYVDSLEDVGEIRKADNRNDPLSAMELKEYRKMTGKVNWLAQSTRPDLCYTGLDMSKKSNLATISDLRRINIVLKKVRERESTVRFCRIGVKED